MKILNNLSIYLAIQYRKPIIIEIWLFFTRYFFSPHFWLLENSKITWFLNFANKKKGCGCSSSWNSTPLLSLSLSLVLLLTCVRPLPLLLLFFCSSWWKRRDKKNDNGKDPALFSSTFATLLLLLLLCFSNSLLSFSVVVVFSAAVLILTFGLQGSFWRLFWSRLLDPELIRFSRIFLFYEHSRFLLLFLFSFFPPTFRHVPF